MLSDDRFAGLVSSVYDAAADADRWSEVLRAMASAFDAPAVVFAGVGSAPRDFWHVAPDVDAAQMDRYAAYYHRINPLWGIALPRPAGTVLTDTMMLSRRTLERTEFFNDFLVPQDFGSMLGAVVHAERDARSFVVVQRRREFDADDVALQRRLAPHLMRAAQLSSRLAALDMRCAAEAEMLDRLEVGAVLLDADSRVLFANRRAEGLIGPHGCFSLSGQVLRARSGPDTARLHAYVARCRERCGDAAGGGCLALRPGQGGSAINVLVLPLGVERPAFLMTPCPVAIVFATDSNRLPAPLPERARQQYGLTRAEAAFAFEIVKGDGIQACADRLGISKATARTHLSHVFEKVGVRRQAELVRLLVRL